MKKQAITICLHIISLCLILTGCNFPPSANTHTKSLSDSPRYVLDNGDILLGNNAYPAISYSGYRSIVRTVENCPTVEDIKEDMRILSAMGIKIIRTYNTQIFPQSERTLRAFKDLKQADPDFEMYVMLGAWIQCKGANGPSPDHQLQDTDQNQREIDKAIELANRYPDIVKIVAVGNEAMVTWQAHFVPASVILQWVNTLKAARLSGQIPKML